MLREKEERLLSMIRNHPDHRVREVAQRIESVPGWTVDDLLAVLREKLELIRTQKV